MTTITKERAELKAFIAGFLSDPAHDNQSSRSMTAEVFRIALASLDAKPIYQYQSGIYNDDNGETDWYWDDCDAGFYKQYAADRRRIVYTAAPAPVVPEEKPMPNPLSMYAVDAVAAIAEVRGWNACRAAMLQGGQPVSQTYELPELIEGMEVSIDVSTCDADFGNRYFGTVTEVSELDTAKNGYILLAQDAKPNFDVNGNSPVSPGGWISCSERMPDEIGRYWCYVEEQNDLGKSHYQWNCSWNGDKWGGEMMSGKVTHWMPLPEPPQEFNRG